MKSVIAFRGNSMYPALCEGDVLTVCYYQKPLLLSQIPVGKVVLLKDQSEWVVHRVINHHEKRLTKGDWSYPLDSIQEAWGEVIELNGRKSAVLESPLIAKISSNLNKKQTRFTRYLRKVLLVFLSMGLRNLKGRRSYDVND